MSWELPLVLFIMFVALIMTNLVLENGILKFLTYHAFWVALVGAIVTSLMWAVDV